MKRKVSCLLLAIITFLFAQNEQQNHNDRQMKQLSYVTIPTIVDVGSGIPNDNYEVAIRLTKEELGESYGKSIREVWFGVYGGYTNGAVNIYKGSKPGNREPDQLIYTMNVDGLPPLQSYWVAEIPADSVKIESGYDYWASFSGNTNFAKGLRVDCGPAVKGKGQWLKYNGVWKEFSEYEGTANPFSYDNRHGNWCIKVCVDGFQASDTNAPEIKSLTDTTWYGGYKMNLTMVVLDASTVPQQMEAKLTLSNGNEIPVNFVRTSDTFTKTYKATIPAQVTGTEGVLTVHLKDTKNNIKWSDPYTVKWIMPKKQIVESFEDYPEPLFNPEWTVRSKWPAAFPTWCSRGKTSGFITGHTGFASMGTLATLATKNEWLISPPMEMIAGQKYKLRFWCRGYSAAYQEKLSVCLGTDSEMDSMYVDTLYVDENILGGPYKKVETLYECKKTGLYNLGFRIYSTGGMNEEFFLDDVEFYNNNASEITKITELAGTHNTTGNPLEIFFIASNISNLSVVSSQYKLEGQSDYTDFNLTGMKNNNFVSGTIPAQEVPVNGTMKIVIKNSIGETQTIEEPIYWHDMADAEIFDFNKVDELPSGWQTWDKDGDGDVWQSIPELLGLNGTNGINSPSCTPQGAALDPDNLLITDKRKIVQGSAIRFNICSQDKYMGDVHYGVGISTTGPKGEYDMIYTEKLPFTNSSDYWQGFWFERQVSLDKYAGQDVWIAFRHYQSPAKFVLTIDSVTIYNAKSVVSVEETIKKEPLLTSCYPNPFNPVTKISFVLPANSNTSLKIYNATGQHVKTLIDNYVTSGKYTCTFDATGLNSGVYFYRLESAGQTKEVKMLLVK